MAWTFDHVKAEHENALASLSPCQIRAIERVQRAAQLTNFNHRPWRENLSAIMASEAERLNCAGVA